MSGMRASAQLVVVGASAGGIEALSALVGTLPPDFPAPVVLAQHLDPRRPSHLSEILARHSALPVRTVKDHEVLAPGVVFVVPADRHVAITDHALSLQLEGAGRSKPSIDLLLSSAAAVFGEQLVAVILTGTGSDGTAGARAVKAAGGVVIIQSPATAKYPDMPASLDPATVDMEADLMGIGPLLQRVLNDAHSPAPPDAEALRDFLAEVRERSGIDFGRYKTPTIQRRLQRRLAATGAATLADYRAYIRDHPNEYGRLTASFLIKVTEFFRDPALFAYLREKVLPELVAGARVGDRTLRLWSAGCATGEEPYSLAILVAEALGDGLEALDVRIYATDLDPPAIAAARRGVYPASALAGVSPELIERYFTHRDGMYTIAKRIRALTVFGEHDLGQRPPFPRIDLCLCRNVLIYFTTELQARALQLFAFALRDGGYLALGISESVRPLAGYFVPVEPELKIYRRHGERLLIPGARLPSERAAPIRIARARGTVVPAGQRAAAPAAAHGEREGLAQGLLGIPVGVVVVDRRYDIQVLNAAARRLLGIFGPAIGDDLIHLAQGVPAPALRASIDAAFGPAASRGAASLTASVETADGEHLAVEIACYPHTSEARDAGEAAHRGADTVLIVAIDVTQAEGERRARADSAVRALREREQEVAGLREELGRLGARREQEQAQLIAQREEETARLGAQLQRLVAANRSLLAANEELAATNLAQRAALDEAQGSALEAQAATEEAETLNEEMQATNEELETLNEEMQATVEELQTANADLRARGEELEEQAAVLEEHRVRGEVERRRLQDILEQSPSMMAVLEGPAHRFAFANAAFLRVAGRAEGEVIGRTMAEVFPELAGQGFDALLDQVYATGTPFSGVEMPKRWDRDGDGRLEQGFFDITYQPLRTAGGAVEGILMHEIEVTDRIQSRARDAETARLTELDRLRAEFVAAVSHHLQTPLTAIRAGLGLLGAGAGDRLQPDERELVDGALQNAERLRIQIADLLAANQIVAGTLKIARIPVDLRSAIARAVAAIHPMLQEKGQALELDLPEALPVLGDARWLEQVVIDLLANAYRHTSTGTRITVSGHCDAGEITLLVRDNGPGISAADLDSIFVRFRRIGPEAGGSGLGLSIVRELVGLHGGRVWAESAPGGGASFYVVLPGSTAGSGAA